MRHKHLQFVAMAFFVTGFVLAGSGWSLVLSSKMQSRPDWSVCGQDMCSCLPSTAIEPYCPLCLVDDDDGTVGESSCSDSDANTDTQQNTPRKRVPKNERFEVASTASQAGCASVFLSFVFGSRQSQALWAHDSIARLISQDDVPLDPLADLPTPPPRA